MTPRGRTRWTRRARERTAALALAAWSLRADLDALASTRLTAVDRATLRGRARAIERLAHDLVTRISDTEVDP